MARIVQAFEHKKRGNKRRVYTKDARNKSVVCHLSDFRLPKVTSRSMKRQILSNSVSSYGIRLP